MLVLRLRFSFVFLPSFDILLDNTKFITLTLETFTGIILQAFSSIGFICLAKNEVEPKPVISKNIIIILN